MNKFLDFRSDTVTKPSAAMRQAMANAEVGDDVYGEDPTVNQLQDRVADLLGFPAALFVPSGCMANQIAIKLLTQPGDEIVIGNSGHSFLFESGATPFISSVQMRILPGDGRFTAQALRSNIVPRSSNQAPTTMVLLENTHNMGGGLIWPKSQFDEVVHEAKQNGLALHLDGARLWNAACASGMSERSWCKGFDTVSVCLSKGLGAPVGSLVLTSKERWPAAHRLRKLLGGGMRQAGILAAAGLYALDHQRERLSVDHDNAKHLAAILTALPGLLISPDAVQTNILIVSLADHAPTASELMERAKSQGLLFGVVGPKSFRMVTHLDVSRADCTSAGAILATCLGN